MVDAIVIMAGGVVVKVDEPYGSKNPAKRCVYEAVEHEMWGVGVAENNAPHQKVTNAAFRLFMEGKGMALLGTASVDRSKFLPTEDFKKFPGKVYQFKPGLSPGGAQGSHHPPPGDGHHGRLDGRDPHVRAVQRRRHRDHQVHAGRRLEQPEQDCLRHLHDHVGLLAADQGGDPEHRRDVDRAGVEHLIEWDLKYLEVETVQKIHGDKIAQLWAQIKQFGKTSFMDWQATGTSLLHAKGGPDQQDSRVLPSSRWATRSRRRWSTRASCCSRRGT
jgi:hypothetical protein